VGLESPIMLASQTEPATVMFAPRTMIEPDGTVEGYASLSGETYYDCSDGTTITRIGVGHRFLGIILQR